MDNAAVHYINYSLKYDYKNDMYLQKISKISIAFYAKFNMKCLSEFLK